MSTTGPAAFPVECDRKIASPMNATRSPKIGNFRGKKFFDHGSFRATAHRKQAIFHRDQLVAKDLLIAYKIKKRFALQGCLFDF